jgi:hypothetical protein
MRRNDGTPLAFFERKPTKRQGISAASTRPIPGAGHRTGTGGGHPPSP